MVIDMSIQDEVHKEISRVKKADRVKIATPKVDTEILQNCHGRASVRGFEFDVDEPKYIAGGQDKAPRPLEYFLAGWAFCQQVQYARSALNHGIPLNSLSMTVSGDINPLSSIDVESDIPTGFVDDELEMRTDIESSADPHDVNRLARFAQRRCHAHATLQRQMTLNTMVRHNGQELEL